MAKSLCLGASAIPIFHHASWQHYSRSQIGEKGTPQQMKLHWGLNL